MLASHITNKEVSKQKVLYPMGYTVYSQDISSHEVVSMVIPEEAKFLTIYGIGC